MAAALFLWTVLGGLAGGFAKSVVWFDSSHHWLTCTLVGVVGGIAGGYLRGLAGPSNGFDLGSMGLAMLGAAATLALYNLVELRRKAATTGSARRAA